MVDDFNTDEEAGLTRRVATAYAFNQLANRWMDTVTGRFVPNVAVIAEMRLHVAATFSTAQSVTSQLYAGSITMEQWQVAVASELKDAHLAQSMFAVGGKRNMTAVEYGRVGGTLRDEYGHLARFADDIAAGKVSEAQALARIKQYGKATQQSYWREYALASGSKIIWQLHPAEHCADCVDLENNNPYTADTLPTYPGAGATRCHGNCNCTLERAA